jgi:hypothetical protein
MMMSRTDKETRLKDFIAESLDALAESPGAAGIVTVIARSNESPAARALIAALSEAHGASLDIRVIVADARTEDPAALSLRDIAGVDCRLLSDPRFGASHEQLVIGRTHVWIGDCLRRDPNKRDAFELYHKADPIARKCAIISFERLWARAKPLMPAKNSSIPSELIAAGKNEDSDAFPRPLRQ